MNSPIPDPRQSFMQNVMASAKQQNIPPSEIVELSGIRLDYLEPARLRRAPLTHADLLSVEQAEKVIHRVAPVELHKDFRTLQGYPEAQLDSVLERLAIAEALKGLSFGEMHRFNREQKKRGEDYVRIADCIMPDHGLGTMQLSLMERGKMQPKPSQAKALMGKLGYSADEAGLQDFLKETQTLLQAYLERQEKFGEALFLHMYPDGKPSKNNRRPPVKTKSEVAHALHVSNGYINPLLNGTYVPKKEEVEATLNLFGYETHAEDAFYANAKATRLNLLELELPQVSSASAAMKRFGRDVKTVREELGIDQTGLCNAVSHSRNNFISYLEAGSRRMPLPSEEQQAIISALGCSTQEELSARADDMEIVKNIRATFFLQAVRKQLDTISDTQIGFAKWLNASDTQHVTPNRAREVLSLLGISEPELYRKSGVVLNEAQQEALRDTNTFVEHFDFEPFVSANGKHVGNVAVGRRSSAEKAR